MNQAITLSGSQHAFSQSPAMPYLDYNLEVMGNEENLVEKVKSAFSAIKEMEINMVESAEAMFNATQLLALGKGAIVAGSQLSNGNILSSIATVGKAAVSYGIGEQVEDVVMDYLETKEYEAEQEMFLSEQLLDDIDTTSSKIQDMLRQ